MPRSRPRRLDINADIAVAAARDSTTQVTSWIAAAINATGSSAHGVDTPTAAPSITMTLATGR